MVKKTEHRFKSHAGQKHHLVARWSKRPIFPAMGRQKGVKNPGGKLSGPLAWRSEVSHGRNFENLTHGRTSKRPNPGFDRTPVKSTISHDGQKDRFVIFGYGAPKVGKKSWLETLRTTGLKFRSESEAPGWHSAIKVHGWHSALCRVPPCTWYRMVLCRVPSCTSYRMGQNRKFWPGESVSLRTFTLMVSLQDILTLKKLSVKSFSGLPGITQILGKIWEKFRQFPGKTWENRNRNLRFANAPR